MKKLIRVWDLPIRLFHWLLVACIVGSLICVNIGGNAIQWHAYFGYSILTLLIFRIIWGFIGSTHARFASFLPNREAITNYLQGKSPRFLGHNPIGALSVFALLLVLSVQAVTGLFVDDEIAFQGPLSKYLSESSVSFLSEIHESNQVVIYTLIAIHIAAIWYYKKLKGEDLIRPMISGDKEIDPSEEAKYLPSDLGRPSKDGGLQRGLALLLLSLIAVVVGYLITVS
ncbi:cytochrome B [Polynucleobacter sp. QLW-P1DATA-2]|jgi:cytochrome b|uniref:cytochrome b/b6 domain-containing protein n=1 Tax=unclassified Polynucleobacter TaxID=2640945 RepID=UPI0008F92DBF|nr:MULTISPECIES: cytochrome b/b6 domain-containing protein [unclassified Polynucleobacter]OIM97311.1 cytochrome B [Polynucleobacter sp. QLW-P1DATA-2]OIN00116.1 cytochrome B [Polynucleobacter sp. MWH-Tro8-2-5-gr]